jgi:FkbM family methyltransferase
MSKNSFLIPFPFIRTVSWFLAPPLSLLVCSSAFHKLCRTGDAYVNFLMGKGSGTGWDLKSEVQAANSCVFRAEPTILDIGANVGEWSQLFLAEIPSAKVFMFEPLERCREEIRRKNLVAQIVPYALSDQEGSTVFHYSSEIDTMASIDQRRDSFYSEENHLILQIETTTIDLFMEKENIEFVDFMKMDIEGHEFKVLCGAKESLRNGKIGALTFEFGAGNVNSRTFFHDFYDLLREFDFEIFRIVPGGRLLQVNEYYEDLEYFRGVSNYLALLKSHPYKVY